MTENHAADPEIGFFVKWILSRLDSRVHAGSARVNKFFSNLNYYTK